MYWQDEKQVQIHFRMDGAFAVVKIVGQKEKQLQPVGEKKFLLRRAVVQRGKIFRSLPVS